MQGLCPKQKKLVKLYLIFVGIEVLTAVVINVAMM
jgi:hypothetical protein